MPVASIAPMILTLGLALGLVAALAGAGFLWHALRTAAGELANTRKVLAAVALHHTGNRRPKAETFTVPPAILGALGTFHVAWRIAGAGLVVNIEPATTPKPKARP